MEKRGILLVVSGFSGAGKGTLMKELLRRYENYALSVSATTRKPREGQLIEYACYVGNYYGTPKAYVEQQLEQGQDVILEIEIQGARKVKERFPDTVLLFVSPPSAEELKRRLTKRGTESPEVIENRLKRAVEEAEGIEDYDYFVINDDLEACAEHVHRIVKCEHSRTLRCGELLHDIREELKAFSK